MDCSPVGTAVAVFVMRQHGRYGSHDWSALVLTQMINWHMRTMLSFTVVVQSLSLARMANNQVGSPIIVFQGHNQAPTVQERTYYFTGMSNQLSIILLQCNTGLSGGCRDIEQDENWHYSIKSMSTRKKSDNMVLNLAFNKHFEDVHHGNNQLHNRHSQIKCLI